MIATQLDHEILHVILKLGNVTALMILLEEDVTNARLFTLVSSQVARSVTATDFLQLVTGILEDVQLVKATEEDIFVNGQYRKV